MTGNGFDVVALLSQIPIVALVVWLVFKFIGVMKEERQEFTQSLVSQREQFTASLDREREIRDGHANQLDHTLHGLTTSVNDLTHAVTEVRQEVKNS